MSRWFMPCVLALCLCSLPFVVGCRRQLIDLNRWPCGPSAVCAEGYVCSNEGECVRFIDTCVEGADTDGDGYADTRCASQVTGADCSRLAVGSVSPCADDPPFSICNEGCKVCEVDDYDASKRVWSSCRSDLCVLGVLHSCGQCGEDCTQLVLGVAAPVCQPSATGERFVCDYVGGCQDGYFDANADTADGCECVKSRGGNEVCDGLDNDCNGQTDEVEDSVLGENRTSAFYLDADGDGFGDLTKARYLCHATAFADGSHYVVNGGDCDDARVTAYPGASELCDGVLNDCTSVSLSALEVDGDNDGYIACDDFVQTGEGAPGLFGGGDCAPANASINPMSDVDGDQVSDCVDLCVDIDGDGVGNADMLDRSRCAFADVPDDDDHDSLRCSDSDDDGCDDCSRGLGMAPRDDGTDVDEDGRCDVTDCDDTIPTCRRDCATNSDDSETERGFPKAVDCVEDFCGTDRADPGSYCMMVDSQARLTDAIEVLNGAAGSTVTCRETRCGILVKDIAVTSSLTAITNELGAAIRSPGGSKITVTGDLASKTLFSLRGDNTVVDGLTIEVSGAGALAVVFYIFDGNNNLIMRNRIKGYLNNAVTVYSSTLPNSTGGSSAVGNWVVGNWLSGGEQVTSAQGHAAVYTRSSEHTRVVGNVVVTGTGDGVHLDTAYGTFLDHNTFVSLDPAANLADRNFAVVPFGTSSINTCMRNNNFYGNWRALLHLTDSKRTTWNTGADCEDVVTVEGEAIYGNNNDASPASNCLISAPCVAIPSGLFYVPPASVSYSGHDDISDPATYYCLYDSILVNRGIDLGYDLASLYSREPVSALSDPSAGSGVYVSPAPDIGARESGVGGCPLY